MAEDCRDLQRQDPRAGALAAGADRAAILALVTDLMLSVRIEEAMRAAGYGVVVLASAAELDAVPRAQPVPLVLLDLAAGAFPIEATLRQLHGFESRPPVLGFFPHVQKDLEARARAAGCDLILPRSRFLLDLPAALALGLAAASDRPREAAP